MFKDKMTVSTLTYGALSNGDYFTFQYGLKNGGTLLHLNQKLSNNKLCRIFSENGPSFEDIVLDKNLWSRLKVIRVKFRTGFVPYLDITTKPLEIPFSQLEHGAPFRTFENIYVKLDSGRYYNSLCVKSANPSIMGLTWHLDMDTVVVPQDLTDRQ